MDAMSTDEEVLRLLSDLRSRVESSSDGGIYGDRSKALKAINALLASPSAGGIQGLLLPTGNLQELALENGWGIEFGEIAESLERLLGIT